MRKIKKFPENTIKCIFKIINWAKKDNFGIYMCRCTYMRTINCMFFSPCVIEKMQYTLDRRKEMDLASIEY